MQDYFDRLAFDKLLLCIYAETWGERLCRLLVLKHARSSMREINVFHRFEVLLMQGPS